MFKVSFVDGILQPYKVIEKPNDKLTKVTVTGTMQLPFFWDTLPKKIFEWISIYTSINIERSFITNSLVIKSTGKAMRVPGDTDVPIVGERIAEARAKIKLYKFMKKLTCKVLNYYSKLAFGEAISPYYGNNFCISAAFDKYCTLYDTEVEHLKSLINNLEE
jgi:hypothetical protein